MIYYLIKFMNNNETILVEKLLFVYHTALKNIKYLFILIILSLVSIFYIFIKQLIMLIFITLK